MFFYREGDFWKLRFRQTWEPEDVDLLATGDLTNINTTSTTTQVVNHSSLSNPLLTGGEKCLYINAFHNRGYTNRLFFSNPAVVGTSETTAVSLRVTARSIGNHGAWRLLLRGTNTSQENITGYWIGIGSSAYGESLISFAGNVSINIPNHIWKRFRIDLVPQIQNGVWAGDLIRGYIADANEDEPNWQLIMETLQTSIPSSHGTYKYHQLEWSDYSGADGSNRIFWIDNFEIYTSNNLGNL